MTKHLFYVLLLTIVASGCDNVEFKKTKGGMPYKLWASKNGKKAEVGKFVKVHYTQKLNDSVLFTTQNGMPMYFPVEAPKGTYDIGEVIPLMKEGDSVMSIQLMDTFFKRDPRMVQGPFKREDKVYSTLKILKVFDRADDYMQDEQAEIKKILDKEPEVVSQYMKKNNVKNAIKTPGGAYVEVLTEGTGPKVDTGKYVTVMYNGKKFDGTVFDSNIDPAFQHPEPLGFIVGRKDQMIPGFDEGVQQLRVGSKARIYIPSVLGYGRNGRAPKIMPFENLVFDVEVVGIADKAPPETQQPQQPVQHPGDKEPH